MLGLSAEQVDAVERVGGSLTLPPVSVYIRLGAIAFPRPRHMAIVWELWPNQAAAVKRVGQCSRIEWLICPEPNVVACEEADIAGKVIAPAKVLPTFDQVMQLATAIGDTAADSLEGLKSVAYQLAAAWPDFVGAEKV